MPALPALPERAAASAAATLGVPAPVLWHRHSLVPVRSVLCHLLLDTLVVSGSVARVGDVGVLLGRTLRVRGVEQVLDPEEDLLEGDAWLPGLLRVEDREAHGAARVDIRVEKAGWELAFRRGVGVIFCELHCDVIQSCTGEHSGIHQNPHRKCTFFCVAAMLGASARRGAGERSSLHVFFLGQERAR